MAASGRNAHTRQIAWYPVAETLREIEFEDEDSDCCPRCGGEGWIDAVDGDPSDWGEDTYCGPEDASLKCRDCNGEGYFRRTSTGVSDD